MKTRRVRLILKFVFLLTVFIGGLCLGIWMGDPYRSPTEYVIRYTEEYPSMTDDEQAEFRHRVGLFVSREIPKLQRIDEEIAQFEREMEEENRTETTTRSSTDWQGIREYWQNWLEEENARLEGVRLRESSD